MTDPIPSWNKVPVHGTYLKADRTAHAGTIRFTITQRVVVADEDVIVPGGGIIDVPLDVDGHFTINLPATDDPDVSPNGFVINVQEALEASTRTAGKGITYDIQPLLSMLPDGLDLSDVVPLTIEAPEVQYKGIPGGYAALDADGDVVDADGVKVTGGGGSGGGDTVDTLGGTGANGRLLMAGTTVDANQTNLGISSYIKPLLNDADLATALTTLGFSVDMRAFLATANDAAALTALGAANATHTHAQSDVTGLAASLTAKADVALLDTMPQNVNYSTGSASYPARPATARRCFFFGPTRPAATGTTAGGGGMVPGWDIWFVVPGT